MLNGLQIIVSHALGPRQVQTKRHKRNRRINKKWLKRYGAKTVDDVLYGAGGVVFMSRAIGRHL